jgi:hypothetical protein
VAGCTAHPAGRADHPHASSTPSLP